MITSGMPELLHEVVGQLVSVEEGLAALDNHKTALHNHADKVKREISGAVECQMGVLRAREKQLIRQVEVASTHQNSEVNVAQAQLLQHKGALAVTRTILDNCNNRSGSSGGPSGGMCDGATSTQNSWNQGCTTDNLWNDDGPFDGTAISCTPLQLHLQAGRAVLGRGMSGDGYGIQNSIATTVNCLPYQDVAGLLQHSEKLLRVPLVSVSLDEASLSASIQRFGRVSLPPSLSHSELLPHSPEEYGDAEHHVLHKSVQPELDAATIDVRRPYLLAARKIGVKGGCGGESDEEGGSVTGSAGDCHSKPLPVPILSDPRRPEDDMLCWLQRLKFDEPTTGADFFGLEMCGSGKSCCISVEDACQANATCPSFSQCLLSGQCKKNALQKAEQSTKWLQRQSQQKDGGANDPEDNSLMFAMDLSLCSRKRHNSQRGNETTKSVVQHMTDILSSSNTSWLMHKSCSQDVLCNDVGKLRLQSETVTPPVTSSESWLADRKVCTSAASFSSQGGYSCKKIKLSHCDTTPNRASVAPKQPIRSAVLYHPPTNDWSLPMPALPELINKEKMAVESYLSITPVAHVIADRVSEVKIIPEIGMDCTEQGTKTWLLPGKLDKSVQLSLKKASNDKENSLCRASIKKAQLEDLISKESNENIKDNIEYISNDLEKCSTVSDIVEKDSWLLQELKAADNKVLDEVMKKKCEWLSSTSLASFSVITDSDNSIGWLLSQ